jgi:hypothetical protein
MREHNTKMRERNSKMREHNDSFDVIANDYSKNRYFAADATEDSPDINSFLAQTGGTVPDTSGTSTDTSSSGGGMGPQTKSILASLGVLGIDVAGAALANKSKPATPAPAPQKIATPATGMSAGAKWAIGIGAVLGVTLLVVVIVKSSKPVAPIVIPAAK